MNPTIRKAVVRTAQGKYTVFFPLGTEYDDAVRFRLYEHCHDVLTTISVFLMVPRALESIKMDFIVTGDVL